MLMEYLNQLNSSKLIITMEIILPECFLFNFRSVWFNDLVTGGKSNWKITSKQNYENKYSQKV
jgi:hypothetical protein